MAKYKIIDKYGTGEVLDEVYGSYDTARNLRDYLAKQYPNRKGLIIAATL